VSKCQVVIIEPIFMEAGYRVTILLTVWQKMVRYEAKVDVERLNCCVGMYSIMAGHSLSGLVDARPLQTAEANHNADDECRSCIVHR